MRAYHARVILGGKAEWVKLPRSGRQQLRGVRADGMKNTPHTGEVYGVRGKCAERVAPRGIEPLFTL